MRKGVWALTRLKMSGGAPLFLSRRKNKKGLVGIYSDVGTMVVYLG